VLTAEERQTLEQGARRPTTAQGLAQRARLVLACATSKTNGEIAAAAGVTRQTVGRWRHRFVRKRLPGLVDEPRPGAPRKITDAEAERVIALTLERTPRDATHWSTRAMAQRSGLSQTAVSRIWRAFGLQPHRSETVHDALRGAERHERRDHRRVSSPPPGPRIPAVPDDA
jgi:transposase